MSSPDRRLVLAVIDALVRLWGSGTDVDIVAATPTDKFPEFRRNPRAVLAEMSKMGLVGFQTVETTDELGKRGQTMLFHLIAPRPEAEAILGTRLADYVDTATVLRLARRSKTVDPKRRS